MVDTEVLQEHQKLDYAKESVKLSRNSKGFTWEIKVIAEGDIFSDADFIRMKKLEEKIFNEYGAKE